MRWAPCSRGWETVQHPYRMTLAIPLCFSPTIQCWLLLVIIYYSNKVQVTVIHILCTVSAQTQKGAASGQTCFAKPMFEKVRHSDRHCLFALDFIFSATAQDFHSYLDTGGSLILSIVFWDTFLHWR